MSSLMRSLTVCGCIALVLAGCAKRDYYVKKNPTSQAVPLYATPATTGVSPAMMNAPVTSGNLPAITSTPIQVPATNNLINNNLQNTTQNTMQPIAYNNMLASPEATGSIPMMPAVSAQEKSVSPMGTYPANTQTVSKYRIESGDTIFSIGRKFNIHPNDIITQNNMMNPNTLSVGQEINIPQSAQKYPAQTLGFQSNQATVNNPVQTASYQNQPLINKAETLTDVSEKNNLLSAVRASRTETAATVMGTVSSTGAVKPAVTPQIQKTASVKYFNVPQDTKIIQKYDGKNSTGVRMVMPSGTTLTSAAAGQVLYVGTVEGYGQMVLIRHANGYVSNYAGLQSIHVKQGQSISAGQKIATVSTSNGDKAQMLYELRDGTKTINPEGYMG